MKEKFHKSKLLSMSIGNPKKFKSFDNLKKELKLNENLEKENDSARLYKSKDSRIKKGLSFSSNNKSKLV